MDCTFYPVHILNDQLQNTNIMKRGFKTKEGPIRKHLTCYKVSIITICSHKLPQRIWGPTKKKLRILFKRLYQNVVSYGFVWITSNKHETCFCAELSHFAMLGDHGILQINRSRCKTEAGADQVGQEEWRMAWVSCMIDWLICSPHFVITMWESFKSKLDGIQLTPDCKLGTHLSRCDFSFLSNVLLFCSLYTWNIIKPEVIFIWKVIQRTKQCYLYTIFFTFFPSLFLRTILMKQMILFQLSFLILLKPHIIFPNYVFTCCLICWYPLCCWSDSTAPFLSNYNIPWLWEDVLRFKPNSDIYYALVLS